MEAFPSFLLLTADPVLGEAIPAQLRHTHGLECRVLDNIAAAQEMLTHGTPTLLLADLSLPDVAAGLAALRRDYPLMALLIIGSDRTRTEEETAHYASLPLARYLPRPVAMPSLLRSIDQLHHARITAGQQALPLIAGWAFHPSERILRHPDGTTPPCPLTDKETAILLALYHHRQQLLSRDDLLEKVWGYSPDINTHTLETHLYRLRGKIRDMAGLEQLIPADKKGYRLQLDE